jgi:hypothetical protein
MLIIDLVKYNNKNSNSFSLSIIKIQSSKNFSKNSNSPPIISAKSRLCFWKKNLKKLPLHKVVKNYQEILLETIYFTWFLFITVFFSNFIILSYIFFLWPPGGGPVAFSTALITWCKLYASYYLFGTESLFDLAVLDCVKPDIDQVASVVYCMIEWKLKRRQIKLFEITIQNTGRQTTTQKFSSQEPRWNSSGTTAQQFQVQHGYFWITLQPHAAYNGSICLCHTFHHLAATR